MSNNFKDLRKAAFAVGFGFTVGKSAGSFAEAIFDSILIVVAERMAKNGSKTMQKILEKQGVKIEKKTKDDDSTTIKMGFQPGGEA